MDRIRLYIDEIIGYKNSFFIHACIFANPDNCDAFEKDMTKLIDENRNVLGKDFKGFHANKLGESNWTKLSPIYEKVIQLIFCNSLSVHIYLESKNKYDKNREPIKNWLKSNLESKDDTNKVRKAFKNLNPNDFPVLYHRFDMLHIFLIHKDKYGQNCEFEIYPDSSGKVTDYKEKSIEFISSDLTKKTFDFYSSFDILANAFIETFDEIGYIPNNNQRVINFSPTDDSDCFLIQACDIIANFLFHYLNYNSGIIDKNSKLKANLFSKYFPLLKGDEFVRKNFTIIDNKLSCINSEMKINITK
ncbi:MAG: hypothetical protein PF484_03495 [Bacteroidales bacterium]|jgi:hypothetical protein|nr:hypothetical protein [Bacteroidales bacterium]